MLELLQGGGEGDPNTVPLDLLLIRLGMAFGLGCLSAGIHYITATPGKKGIDRSFLATLVLLSVLIALVTIVIGSNVARAFSLVGTLAIVRFRTVVEDTSDTAFVIYSVAAGMCAGSGYLAGPLVCAPLVLAAAAAFRPRRRNEATGEGSLILRLPAGHSPDPRIGALLNHHLGNYRLSGLSTARGGAALDVTYAIPLRAPETMLELVNELSRVEGVQAVELKGN
jgi:hypothetical protein